jgi:hypothetical protein
MLVGPTMEGCAVQEDYDVDLAVIGSGGAAMAAGITRNRPMRASCWWSGR